MEMKGNALVIGGGSGICRATAIGFAMVGVTALVVADVDLKAAERTADASKNVATNPDFVAKAIEVDISIPDQVQKATTVMIETFGRIDYCVNGAGITSAIPRPIADIDFAQFQKIQDVNVNGTFLVLKAVSASMASQEPRVIDERQPERGVSRGSIVTVASVLSCRAIPNTASYTTSKHAILGLTRAAAMDNIKNGIRVNCVCPSWVNTPMVERTCESAPGFDKLIQSQLPMGRMGTPEEIADAIIFLCSPRASWVNGSNMMVDGAMSVCP
ncbi:hypothetical protein GGR56DRAFT_629159 [Xylariaceae sp. FL0804]|nr:hypothetical protein GGR56DRAFT_629159 [Xylariaceae sp. FL0804]